VHHARNRGRDTIIHQARSYVFIMPQFTPIDYEEGIMASRFPW